jgi:predicted kinase
MRQIQILVGCPASGKSTYCRELMIKEPERWKRINNDAIRELLDFGVWSQKNEALVRKVRTQLLREALKANFDVLLDNVHCGEKHFNDYVSIVEDLGIEAEIVEQPFYIDLATAIARDEGRSGNAKVGAKVVSKWWKDLGGEKFKDYEPRTLKLMARPEWTPLKQDKLLDDAIIVDVDGTIAEIGDRSPYDASRSDETDTLNPAMGRVIDRFKDDYTIIFCSGRMEKDRIPTYRFIKKHFPELEYHLFMRKDNDMRKDAIVKEEIFNAHIRNKFYVAAVFDDRLQVCRMWHRLGLRLLRVGDPDANF